MSHYAIKLINSFGEEDSYRFYEHSFKGLKNKDKVVSKRKELVFKLEYPFGNSPVYVFESKTGKWTLEKILRTMIKAYRRAYREEDSGSEAWEIWGHELDDLSIDCITINKAGIVTCANSS